MRFSDEAFAERGALTRSLSALLKLMELWGLYVRRRNVGDTTIGSRERWHCCKPEVGPMVILAILWLSVCVYVLSVFNGNDSFGSPLTANKLTFLALLLQGTLMQTSYFYASRGGKLDRVLDELRVTADFVERTRKLSVTFVLCSIVNDVVCITFVAYVVLLTGSSFGFLVAPLTTRLPIDSTWLYVAKSAVIVILMLAFQGWLATLVMNTALTYILYQQFDLVNERFRASIDSRGKFNGEMKVIRNRHQTM